ncbi:MAG: hypothetical protein C0501_26245 [Isosphaera sp.]|nr:hypothetical protein [Isosphaera sp.]
MSPIPAVLFGSDALAELLNSLPTAAKWLLSAGFAALLPMTWWVARRYYRSRVELAERRYRHESDAHDTTKESLGKVQGRLIDSQGALAAAQAELQQEQRRRHAAEKDLQEARHDLAAAVTKLTKAEADRDRLHAEGEQLRREVAVLRHNTSLTEGELRDRTQALARLERRMKSALKLEGQLWNAKALQKRPKFCELKRRKQAVISVLNLKGGVGKTTVTAHLGAALARRGYRVLLLDLDLQGSLTSLLLPQDKINQVYADKRLIQNFLQRAAEDRPEKLAGYVVEVFTTPEGGALDLVGTTDTLAYAELNLTMRWLMGTGERDTRFLLRKALHRPRGSELYDVVLIDCPPLVNISCVNALAASDYLLIPTTLSRKSLERVPKLLGEAVLRDERFLRYINPKLQVLGLLANRTYRDDLTGDERTDWNHLAAWAKDAYGKDVTRFGTIIPQIKGVQQSETEFSPAGGGGRLEALFAQLAAEVEKELPSECRRTAKTPS